jgi:hypothetical protein
VSKSVRLVSEPHLRNPRYVPVMCKVVYSLVLYGKLICVLGYWLYQGRGCAVVPVMG